MPELWPGGKGLGFKKHRPSHFGFRIVDFGFFGPFVFQSAFRNLQSAIPMADPAHEMKDALVFEPQTLAPGPGIGVQAMATFSWCSFQSALSGSGVPMAEVMTFG